MRLSAEQLTVFLLSVGIILLTAKLFGELFVKLKQPAVIGEIIAGIILGPTVLGTVFPGVSNYLFPDEPSIIYAFDGLTSLAVVMLLLISGLEVDLSIVLRQGKTALYTSLMGIIFPFAIGFFTAYLFPGYLGIGNDNLRLVFALFMGTAMSISALPVIARTLMDLGIFRTEIGLVIIASAMFNDLVGWIIFSVILGMLGNNNHGLDFTQRIMIILGFVLFMLVIGRKIVHQVFPFIQNKFSYPGGVLNFIFILGFLCAAFTEAIGVHAIFGAFIIGVTIGDTAHLKEKIRDTVNHFVTNIFAPLFFASIGLRVNFFTNFDIGIVAIIIIIAFIGKVIGCGLGARWGGMSTNDSLAVGFGMNSRGAMEIILGLLALQTGLIQEKVFVALVIMALFTSVSSAPFMSFFMRDRRKVSFINLLDPQLVILTDAQDKSVVIKELVTAVCNKHNFDKERILSAVNQREELIPTGIANYLAIPHARVNINKPVIAIGITKTGIDFAANDNILSRVVILLLTPLEKNELQLQLLSDISSKFRDKVKVEKILEASSINEFLFKLKQDL